MVQSVKRDNNLRLGSGQGEVGVAKMAPGERRAPAVREAG